MRSARPDNSISFNYQVLEKRENVTIGWKFDESICATSFHLQGFSINNKRFLEFDHLLNGSIKTIDILPNQLVTDNGPIYFRLVAVRDGDPCSDLTTQRTLYRFDGKYCYLLIDNSKTSSYMVQ